MKTIANKPNASVKKNTAPAVKKISSGDQSLDNAIVKFFPLKPKQKGNSPAD